MGEIVEEVDYEDLEEGIEKYDIRGDVMQITIECYHDHIQIINLE